MMPELRRYHVKYVVLCVAAAVLPLLVRPYYVDALTVLLINAVLVASFRFITLIGEFSFCHVGMMAVGALTSAMLTTQLGWPFWVSLPVAGFMSGFVAWALSYPLLRMRGLSFFIGSFAAGEIIRLSWLRFQFLGGHAGIEGIPSPSLPGVDFHGLTAYYYLTLCIAALCLFVLWRIEHSRSGVTMKAVAAKDFLAQSVGVNVHWYRTIGFVGGSFFAGIAGVLLAHRLGAVDSHQFIFSYNLSVIVWVLFGGVGSFIGPLAGLTIFTGIDEAIYHVAGLGQWSPFIYGVVLLATLLVLPRGIVSLPEKVSPLLSALPGRHRKVDGVPRK